MGTRQNWIERWKHPEPWEFNDGWFTLGNGYKLRLIKQDDGTLALLNADGSFRSKVYARKWGTWQSYRSQVIPRFVNQEVQFA